MSKQAQAQVQRDHVLGRYLRGELTRRQAIEDEGIDWVELAERQHTGMHEDLAWAMRRPASQGL